MYHRLDVRCELSNAMLHLNEGQGWGNNGYARVLRGKNILGIESRVIRPIVNFQKAKIIQRQMERADYQTNRARRPILRQPPFEDRNQWEY
jgi:hypothetical protein